jgi:ABC-type bacteriocin/lantibiotic exporter with double-glycine peptidase domain
MIFTRLIKRSFIRQSSEADCGLACLSMILNYSGRADRVHDLRCKNIPPNGLSLLELRELAWSYQLTAQCVELDPTYLRNLRQPSILLVKNEREENHYIVCYGGRKRANTFRYYIADPAEQIHWVSEEALLRQWPSRTALYFQTLDNDLTAFRRSNLWHLLSISAYPRALWAVIPVLTLCSVLSGISLTWLLQKGMTERFIFSGRIIVPLLFLLLLINLFKGVFALLKQLILVRINLSVNRYLWSALMNRLFSADFVSFAGHFNLKQVFKDMQKAQNALSAWIATLLPDAFLLILLLAGVAYLNPMAFLLNLLFLMAAGLMSFRSMPAYFSAYNYIAQSIAFGESETFKDLERLQAIHQAGLIQAREQMHRSHHLKTTRMARILADQTSLTHFAMEALAAINVVVIIAVQVSRLQALTMPYDSFMLVVIFTYLTGNLFSRIHNGWFVILDGADAFVQFKAAVSGLTSHCG